MPAHEARNRAVYDHDTDGPRSTGRRRRPVDDWGVGDELFDHLPHRRRERGRRRDDASRRAAVDRHGDASPRASGAERRGDASPHGSAVERFAEASPRHVPGSEAPPPADGVGGARRPIKIDGRPGEAAFAVDRRRRRPSRTVHERVGARPDRVAAWACVLGLLLILIAVATAQAAAPEASARGVPSSAADLTQATTPDTTTPGTPTRDAPPPSATQPKAKAKVKTATAPPHPGRRPLADAPAGA